LDDVCLLPAWFCYVIINIRYMKSNMHIANWCAPRKKFPMVRRTLFCILCNFNKWHSAANSQGGQA
jgi:hypothetical protein